MNTRAEKISLLSEMIAFSLVDGELHDREFDFLQLLSIDFGIEKLAFMDLFRKRDELIPIKNEFQRIIHFYKLALLMHSDSIIKISENEKIHEIGIKMGLNPVGTNRVLKLMEESDNQIIAPELVITAFQEQLN